MRILQVNSQINFGGGEKHFVDLCNGLQQRGHEVYAAISARSQIPEKGLEIAPENQLRADIKNSIDISAASKIAKVIRELEIDIIHAHTGKDYLPVSLAARLAKTGKFVITRHVVFPLKLGQRFFLSNLSKAIAVSSAVEESLRRTFPLEKIAVIPNGIKIEKLSKSEQENLPEKFRLDHGIDQEKIVITAVGELKFLKGQRDLILAAHIIVEKCPNVHFIIVGDDHSSGQKFRKELKRLVKIFSLESKFSWLNWVEDTRALFAATDIFISPSHSESFGLAILEAMASGCAVITTKTGGATELIIDGVSGAIVPVSDPTRLAERTTELIADRSSFETFGREAQRRAIENFGLEKMIDLTEELYSKL